METNRDHYLGDGVYVQVDEWGQVILTTEDGDKVTNTVVLNDAVFRELMQAINAAKHENRHPQVPS